MRKLILFLFVLLLPFSANAVTCNPGYYLDNGTCKECLHNHYCPGDDVMYDCPPITYTDAELKQLAANNGYEILSYSDRILFSQWARDGRDNISIGYCFMGVREVETPQGHIATLGYIYDNTTHNYTHFVSSYWRWANNGYYLTGAHPSGELWLYAKPCTNSHPSNSHYSGAGTPDSVDGTIADANDCPWECDAGYWNDNGVCTQCPAGYYINNGQCVSCENDHYCTGDGTMHACPAITYNDAQLKQLIESKGFTGVTYAGQAALSTLWFDHPWTNTSIEHCAMIVDGTHVTQGILRVLGFRYDTSTNNYTSLRMTYWLAANPGYYLTDIHPSGEMWSYVKQCTNSRPSNSHYSGAGTPDNLSGTVVDANDCPWACDAGFGQHGEYECLPLCEAGVKELHFGDRYVNMYKYKYTSPAIHIENNGTVCYVRLELGESSGLNVHTNGRTFHAVD